MVEKIQWAWIISVGFAASTMDYSDELLRIVVTVASMTIGTVVSFFVKKWLNDWRDRR